ncbi:Bifunctional DNA primase/polymerase (plasmid) [Deinococcus proteolyticus MRP]|uniref:Bifunctional DNA primase/polymerase n=1 Tax=Deinococcus proteolyticus (strain ATCC 35074 / DSM 20540 / JCM 6276 / NBRC 101906 / NCIMB 13154 / VKM Ac-1939 / CCM 2703 / MRP) TaxID=693977 RepID=F0RQP1_DEIPM|nr:bifunctional DNA primase/polymerase [Deinococcus proteolyticus]ADY27600.1 Bifunctional DNA primase/polymerase [Deinococcus proteolyticus MRP]
MSLLQAALGASDLGWNVLPVDHHKRPHRRLTLTGHSQTRDGKTAPSWKPLQTQRVQTEWLHTWFTPDVPGLAAVTGAISSLVVLDFDGEAGWALLRKWGLSPNALSGSGSPHVYFEHPGWHVRTVASGSLKNPPFPGLDVRADGGMIVLPPSHLSNGAYRMLDVSPQPVDTLPEAVALWVGLLPTPAVTLPEAPLPEAGTDNDLRALLDEAVSRSAQGRNNAGYWLARQLAAQGLTRSDAEPWIRRFQATMPDTDSQGRRDPYTLTHALSSLHSAYASPVRSRGARRTTQGMSLQQVQVALPRLNASQRAELARLLAGAAYRLGGLEMAAATLREVGLDQSFATWAHEQAQRNVSLPGWPRVERFLKQLR